MPCLSFFSGAAWLLWLVRGICLLAIIAVIALLLRPHQTAHGAAVDALGILHERLARGEISDQEFEAKRALLNR